MSPIPEAENETPRIQALRELLILDTPPERIFDDIVLLAAQACDTCFALITLVDSNREWFKAKKGIADSEQPRESGFGSQTIPHRDVVAASNLADDSRFSANALVASAPNLRFYAGAPIRTPTGEAIGALCVLDTIPRELSLSQIDMLRILARQVYSILASRLERLTLSDALANTKRAEQLSRSIANISEHKRPDHRFQQAVESAPNAIVMVNASGTILLVNVQTEMSFGYSRTELVGQPVEMLVPERFRVAHIGFRQAYLAEPVSRPMGVGRELYGLRKDGSEFPVEIGLGPIDDADGTIILSSIIDITERKNANDNLKAALQEKEMLLKEVYHRVKNNLQVVSSLINLQAGNVKNEATVDLLKQSADRIKAMALLHEKLYHSKDLARIDFNEYIRSLVDHLLFGYGTRSGKINIDMKIDNVFLDVDTAIPCGLIVNELVSNALKHAFPGDRPGEIGITFTHAQDQFMLAIADNGIGLPADLDFKKSTSLGLQLVDSLTNQLMGQMSLDRENGSTFTLRFNKIT